MVSKKSCFSLVAEKKCKHYENFSQMAENEKVKAFREGVTLAIDTFCNDTEVARETVVSLVEAFLKRRYASLKWEIKISQNEALAKDIEVISKLVMFLKENVCEIIGRDVYNEQAVNEELILTSKMDLIYKDPQGKVIGLKITNKKPFISAAAQKYENTYGADADGLINSLYLNKHYADIPHSYCRLFLLGKHEGPFVHTSGKTSDDYHFYNAFTDSEVVMGHLDVLLAKENTQKCADCHYRGLCKSESLEDGKRELFEREQPKSVDYETLTDEQKQVVCTEGNLVVCAGPGSGKTHTLVAKTLKVMETVPGDFITLITFTNEAAKQMKERLVAAGVAEEELPWIGTIHSLAMNILTDCKDTVGYLPQILTDDSALMLIQKCLDKYFDMGKPVFEGFDLSFMTGPNGLPAIFSAIKSIEKDGAERFFEKYSRVSRDFLDFYEYYCSQREEMHYISYDEAISMANHLLATNDDIRQGYQSNFVCLMVDEMQDVDGPQNEFIMHLTNNAKNDNLIVFGDDDQTIYQFRAASSEYMRELSRREDFNTIKLTKNFRSGEKIVGFANMLLKGMTDERIEKSIKAHNGGGEIYHYNGKDAADLESVVEYLVSNGYRYGDIAVLSRANATLEKLAEKVSFPKIMQKRFLRNTSLVHILNSAVRGIADDSKVYLRQFLHLLDINVLCDDVETFLYENKGEQLCRTGYNILKAVKTAGDREISETIERVSVSLGLSGSEEEQKLIELVETNKVKTLEDFRDMLYGIIEYNSDIKIPVAQKDRVMFITQHESKGLEWPVVIYIAASGSKSSKQVAKSEDGSDKLFYVTATRAKNVLINMGQDFANEMELGTKAEFVKELAI